MKFLYRPIVSAAPDGNDFLLILRPEIPVTVTGESSTATYSGLVDTGSDNTIFPKSVANDLGISLELLPGPQASVFGGQRVQLFVGEAQLQIESEGEKIQWRASLFFFDFVNPEDETVLLGHAGFLDYFTATFDGKEGVLSLVQNDDLPVVS